MGTGSYVWCPGLHYLEASGTTGPSVSVGAHSLCLLFLRGISMYEVLYGVLEGRNSRMASERAFLVPPLGWCLCY